MIRQPNPIANLLQHDEYMDKKRQLNLYGNNLVFDPDRPISQQVIRLNNYLSPENEEVFQQLLNNMADLHPDVETKQLAKEYMKIQEMIDRSSQGYLDEVEIELNNTVQQLKDEIVKANEKIKQIRPEVDKLEQQDLAKKFEINNYLKYIENLKAYVQKLPERETLIGDRQKKLSEVVGDLVKKTKQKLAVYANLYNQINKMQSQYTSQNQQWKQKKNTLKQLKQELDKITPVTLKIQLEIEQLKQKIRKQDEELQKMQKQKTRQQAGRNSQRSNLNRSLSEISNNTEAPVTTLLNTKFYVTIKKEQEEGYRKWLPQVLVLVTIVLTLATIAIFLF